MKPVKDRFSVFPDFFFDADICWTAHTAAASCTAAATLLSTAVLDLHTAVLARILLLLCTPV